LLQDIESRHEKTPGLLGEGPAPPQQQLPILPPSVGQVFFFYSLLIFLCLIENVLQEKFEDTNDVITIRNLRKNRQTMIDIILHRKLMIEQHEPH
jgi:hypothetical protein